MLIENITANLINKIYKIFLISNETDITYETSVTPSLAFLAKLIIDKIGNTNITYKYPLRYIDDIMDVNISYSVSICNEDSYGEHFDAFSIYVNLNIPLDTHCQSSYEKYSFKIELQLRGIKYLKSYNKWIYNLEKSNIFVDIDDGFNLYSFEYNKQITLAMYELIYNSLIPILENNKNK